MGGRGWERAERKFLATTRAIPSDREERSLVKVHFKTILNGHSSFLLKIAPSRKIDRLFASVWGCPMVERRERVVLNQLALLCVDRIRGCHPCIVVNIHDGRAVLHSDTHHTAAFKFDLSLDGFKTTKRCRVVWRSGNTCGVEFTGAPG
jgi:hypothetical protein